MIAMGMGTVASIIFLLLTSMLLLAYREPEGAYEVSVTSNEHTTVTHSIIEFMETKEITELYYETSIKKNSRKFYFNGFAT